MKRLSVLLHSPMRRGSNHDGAFNRRSKQKSIIPIDSRTASKQLLLEFQRARGVDNCKKCLTAIAVVKVIQNLGSDRPFNYLKLKDLGLIDDDINALCIALEKVPIISALDLRDNSFTATAAERIVQTMQNQLSVLQRQNEEIDSSVLEHEEVALNWSALPQPARRMIFLAWVDTAGCKVSTGVLRQLETLQIHASKANVWTESVFVFEDVVHGQSRQSQSTAGHTILKVASLKTALSKVCRRNVHSKDVKPLLSSNGYVEFRRSTFGITHKRLIFSNEGDTNGVALEHFVTMCFALVDLYVGRRDSIASAASTASDWNFNISPRHQQERSDRALDFVDEEEDETNEPVEVHTDSDDEHQLSNSSTTNIVPFDHSISEQSDVDLGESKIAQKEIVEVTSEDGAQQETKKQEKTMAHRSIDETNSVEVDDESNPGLPSPTASACGGSSVASEIQLLLSPIDDTDSLINPDSPPHNDSTLLGESSSKPDSPLRQLTPVSEPSLRSDTHSHKTFARRRSETNEASLSSIDDSAVGFSPKSHDMEAGSYHSPKDQSILRNSLTQGKENAQQQLDADEFESRSHARRQLHSVLDLVHQTRKVPASSLLSCDGHDMHLIHVSNQKLSSLSDTCNIQLNEDFDGNATITELLTIHNENLQELLAENNRLGEDESIPIGIPCGIMFPRLHTLDLSHNSIKSIDSFLHPGCFPELKALNVSNNLISSIRGIRGCPKLIRLNLANNLIRRIDELSVLKHIESLDLSYNKLRGFQSVRTLSFNLHLQELWVEGNNVSQHKRFRSHMVTLLPSLIELDGRLLPPSKANKRLLKRKLAAKEALKGSMKPKSKPRSAVEQIANSAALSMGSSVLHAPALLDLSQVDLVKPREFDTDVTEYKDDLTATPEYQKQQVFAFGREPTPNQDRTNSPVNWEGELFAAIDAKGLNQINEKELGEVLLHLPSSLLRSRIEQYYTQHPLKGVSIRRPSTCSTLNKVVDDTESRSGTLDSPVYVHRKVTIAPDAAKQLYERLAKPKSSSLGNIDELNKANEKPKHLKSQVRNQHQNFPPGLKQKQHVPHHLKSTKAFHYKTVQGVHDARREAIETQNSIIKQKVEQRRILAEYRNQTPPPLETEPSGWRKKYAGPRIETNNQPRSPTARVATSPLGQPVHIEIAKFSPRGVAAARKSTRGNSKEHRHLEAISAMAQKLHRLKVLKSISSKSKYNSEIEELQTELRLLLPSLNSKQLSELRWMLGKDKSFVLDEITSDSPIRQRNSPEGSSPNNNSARVGSRTPDPRTLRHFFPESPQTPQEYDHQQSNRHNTTNSMHSEYRGQPGNYFPPGIVSPPMSSETAGEFVSRTRMEQWIISSRERIDVATTALDILVKMSCMDNYSKTLVAEYRERLVDVGLWEKVEVAPFPSSPTSQDPTVVAEHTGALALLRQLDIVQSTLRQLLDLMENEGPGSYQVVQFREFIVKTMGLESSESMQHPHNPVSLQQQFDRVCNQQTQAYSNVSMEKFDTKPSSTMNAISQDETEHGGVSTEDGYVTQQKQSSCSSSHIDECESTQAEYAAHSRLQYDGDNYANQDGQMTRESFDQIEADERYDMVLNTSDDSGGSIIETTDVRDCNMSNTLASPASSSTELVVDDKTEQKPSHVDDGSVVDESDATNSGIDTKSSSGGSQESSGEIKERARELAKLLDTSPSLTTAVHQTSPVKIDQSSCETQNGVAPDSLRGPKSNEPSPNQNSNSLVFGDSQYAGVSVFGGGLSPPAGISRIDAEDSLFDDEVGEVQNSNRQASDKLHVKVDASGSQVSADSFEAQVSSITEGNQVQSTPDVHSKLPPALSLEDRIANVLSGGTRTDNNTSAGEDDGSLCSGFSDLSDLDDDIDLPGL